MFNLFGFNASTLCFVETSIDCLTENHSPVLRLTAGTQIKNTFCVGENLEGIDETGSGVLAAGTAINDTTCSNTAIDGAPQSYDVDADDTDGDGNNDEDGAPVTCISQIPR